MTTPGIVARALIVDDEPLARRHLRALLADDAEIEVVGECATGVEAVDAIHERTPDIVLLDIQMPELDGVGVAESVGVDAMPLTIFVTAHDDRALDAFRVHAVDYLLKPVDRERFSAALQRAKDTLRGRLVRDPARLPGLLAALRASRPEPPERFAVRIEGRTVLLRARDLDWLEADDNNVVIHAYGRALRTRDTLANLESRIGSPHLVRVHRSAVVNVTRVTEVRASPHGEYVISLMNGSSIQTGRRYRDAVLAIAGRSRVAPPNPARPA